MLRIVASRWAFFFIGCKLAVKTGKSSKKKYQSLFLKCFFNIFRGAFCLVYALVFFHSTVLYRCQGQCVGKKKKKEEEANESTTTRPLSPRFLFSKCRANFLPRLQLGLKSLRTFSERRTRWWM